VYTKDHKETGRGSSVTTTELNLIEHKKGSGSLLGLKWVKSASYDQTSKPGPVLEDRVEVGALRFARQDSAASCCVV
jgi:hypothetical protein